MWRAFSLQGRTLWNPAVEDAGWHAKRELKLKTFMRITFYGFHRLQSLLHLLPYILLLFPSILYTVAVKVMVSEMVQLVN